MALKRGGYLRALINLSRDTVDQLLDTLRQQRLRIEQIPSEVLKGSSSKPKITKELSRLPIYLARGGRSWSGLVVCFPGNRKELTTEFVGTPYLRRILYPILDLHGRLRRNGAGELQTSIGEAFLVCHLSQKGGVTCRQLRSYALIAAKK